MKCKNFKYNFLPFGFISFIFIQCRISDLQNRCCGRQKKAISFQLEERGFCPPSLQNYFKNGFLCAHMERRNNYSALKIF